MAGRGSAAEKIALRFDFLAPTRIPAKRRIEHEASSTLPASSGTMPDKVRITLRNQASTAVVQDVMDPAANTGTYMWTVPGSIPDGRDQHGLSIC